MPAAMSFGVALSTAPHPARAAAEACEQVRAALGGASATLAIAFVSPDLFEDGEALVAMIHERLAPEHLLGCMGETIIGAGREVEGGPALALWAAHLPGATIRPFRLSARPLEDGLAVLGWPDDLGADPLILLADPFTFPADGLLAQLNSEDERIEVVGGLASGGRRPGDHRLIIGHEVFDEGAVAVSVGGVPMITVVSQGCAPIGPDMVVTAGEGPVVEELAGKRAIEKLEEVVTALDDDERRLAAQGLLAGLVIDENLPDYGRGDYLIRGITGGDQQTGALYVGERVRIGQTMRFHVRDASSADQDLRQALRLARGVGGTPAGGLIFSCNGRGTMMFGGPDHDAVAVLEELGPVPTAGLFCNGEIGPVGHKNFLHGFTATMALFCAPSAGA
jgi:small ligand-binding sensory domain FIST